MNTDENVSYLVKEYSDLLIRKGDSFSMDRLVAKHDWSPAAAEHLLWLVNKYGSFMLRNAFALSIALGIDDGELGF